MEVWKVLDEFPNYSISSEGRVRNDYYRRLLKISVTRDGTPKVNLSNTIGRYDTRAVRTLVAHMFVPNETETFNTPINLDGNKLNNFADNLAWRPRWFAVKYGMQFQDPNIQVYHNSSPVVHVESNTTYPSVYAAGTDRGFLFLQIMQAAFNHATVFPYWEHFVFLDDVKE